jgi:ATP-dependent phosphoenolpyruvate carboxykinase
MAWAVFMAICSGLTGVCSGTYSPKETYKDYHSCIRSGSAKVLEIIDNIDRKEFNKEKIIVRFYCQEINENQTNKPTKKGFKLS